MLLGLLELPVMELWPSDCGWVGLLSLKICCLWDPLYNGRSQGIVSNNSMFFKLELNAETKQGIEFFFSIQNFQ